MEYPWQMLCEAKTRTFSNIETYTAHMKKLYETLTSVLENNFGVHGHGYEDNFYNSVKLSE
jgi:hypothetical protein